MKKIILIALALVMLFCFAACEPAPANDGYIFKSGEVKIGIGYDADGLEIELGEPQGKVETDSCGGGAEPDREFTYVGFKFNTINENGVNKVVKIVLTDDSVKTPEGIGIGDGREAVIEAYGSDFTETADGALVYTDGETKLMFGIKDGAVSAIHYIEA